MILCDVCGQPAKHYGCTVSGDDPASYSLYERADLCEAHSEKLREMITAFFEATRVEATP